MNPTSTSPASLPQDHTQSLLILHYSASPTSPYLARVHLNDDNLFTGTVTFTHYKNDIRLSDKLRTDFERSQTIIAMELNIRTNTLGRLMSGHLQPTLETYLRTLAITNNAPPEHESPQFICKNNLTTQRVLENIRTIYKQEEVNPFQLANTKQLSRVTANLPLEPGAASSTIKLSTLKKINDAISIAKEIEPELNIFLPRFLNNEL